MWRSLGLSDQVPTLALSTVSVEALNSDIMVVSFTWVDLWVWYLQHLFTHNLYLLVICKCYFTYNHWQDLSSSAKPPGFGTSFLLLLLKHILLPLPSHWLCKEAHLLLFIMPFMSAVFCCTFSFLGYLPSLCVHKEESNRTWYALSQQSLCLGDSASSSAIEHGALYDSEQCHPFLLQDRRNCQYNE